MQYEYLFDQVAEVLSLPRVDGGRRGGHSQLATGGGGPGLD